MKVEGAVEYTDCISAVGYDPALPTTDAYMTLNNLIMRLQSCSFGDGEYLFIAIASRSTLGSDW